MPEGYWIKRIELGRCEVLVLANGERPTFLEKASIERASRMASFMCKVSANGVSWALESGVLKMVKGIKGSVSVFELKCKGTVIRDMTYIHDGFVRRPVYLYDVDAHRGSDGGYSQAEKHKALCLAKEAKRCME